MTGRWIYRVSAVGVLVLAAAAFTLSYDALHELALDSRVRPGLAWLWPMVIDGTIVVALLTVLAAKRATAKAGYPWALAGLFSLASVPFNIAHAPQRPVAQLVFAMAPVALVLTTHLLMQQVGWRHRRTPLDQTTAQVTSTAATAAPPPSIPKDTAAGMSATVGMAPGSRMDRDGSKANLVWHSAGRGADTAGLDRDGTVAMSGLRADLHLRARQIYQEHQAMGRRVSGAQLARQLGTSERYGRRLLAEFRTKDEGSAGRNGDGVAQHKQVGPSST
jgi:Protein of unknown function (DUF2637)